MSVPSVRAQASLLDHVVLAGPDLAEVVTWFADLTGVQAQPGGTHPTGTANALVAFSIDGQRGPYYLELIGPDPDRGHDHLPSKFGIDGLTGPTVVTYAVHPPDLQATVDLASSGGYEAGPIGDLSRRTPAGELLEWRLTPQHRNDIPFLIDWGATAQPGLGDLPVIELESFERVEPDPAGLNTVLSTLGLGDGLAPVVAGAVAGYRMSLRSDAGVVDLT